MNTSTEPGTRRSTGWVRDAILPAVVFAGYLAVTALFVTTGLFIVVTAATGIGPLHQQGPFLLAFAGVIAVFGLAPTLARHALQESSTRLRARLSRGICLTPGHWDRGVCLTPDPTRCQPTCDL